MCSFDAHKNLIVSVLKNKFRLTTSFPTDDNTLTIKYISTFYENFCYNIGIYITDLKYFFYDKDNK